MLNFEYLIKARKKLNRGAWDYLVGGSDDEITLRRNRLAFQEWALRPHALVDVSHIGLSTTFLGIDLPFPVICAPIGGLTQFHTAGEVEWAYGIKESGTLGVVSGVSRIEPERVIRESRAALYYQLYYFGDMAWVEKQLTDAKINGYRAIVVTTDTAYYGNRERDLLNHYDARYAGWRSAPPPPDRSQNTKLTWEVIEHMTALTDLPLILKGTFSSEDIPKALRSHVKALWISNHGGRQLDYCPSSLQMLQDITRICHENELPIIMDGGIRRGTDVVIALLLGADLVAVGRLPIFGLIVDGRNGVKQTLHQLSQEIQTALGLLGIRSISELRSQASTCLMKSNIPALASKWEKAELSTDHFLKKDHPQRQIRVTRETI